MAKAGRRDLAKTLKEVRRASKAEATWDTYGRAEGARRKMASAMGLEEHAPASLVAYLLDKIAKGAGQSAIGTSIAAFKAAGGEVDRETGEFVKEASKAAAKRKPAKPTPRAGQESVERLLQWTRRAEARREDVRLGGFVALSVGALLRVGEAVALKWTDIKNEEEDLSWKVAVRVRKAKNDQEGEGRTTHFTLQKGSIEAEALLCFMDMEEKKHGPIFASYATGKPLRASTMRRSLKEACAAVGVEEFTPHTLRVEGATREVERGSTLEEVRRKGRWMSATGVERYVRDSPATQGSRD